MALNGIDCASYQAGIDPARVPCDLVVVKATQGTGYVNPDYRRLADATLAAGRLLGCYHYAGGGSASAEAAHFAEEFAPYLGRAVPFLDWEGIQNPAYTGTGADAAWVAEFRQTLHARTGVWAPVYLSASVMGTVGLGPSDLWVAQYASDADVWGYQARPWNEGAYACMMRQYTSCGRLDGWGGRLDLNKFYGSKEDWMRYANPSGQQQAPHVDVPAEEGAVYRLYNPSAGDHLLTADHGEAEALANSGWSYEGVAFRQGLAEDVWRLYLPKTGDHLYTTSLEEVGRCVTSGWGYEGVAFRAGGGVEVNRLYNPHTGDHLFTCDPDERDALAKAGWQLEGVPFRAA